MRLVGDIEKQFAVHEDSQSRADALETDGHVRVQVIGDAVSGELGIDATGHAHKAPIVSLAIHGEQVVIAGILISRDKTDRIVVM